MSKVHIITNTIQDVGFKYFEHCSFLDLKDFIKKEFKCSEYLSQQSARKIHRKMNGEKFLTKKSNPKTIKKNLSELLKIENVIFLKSLGSTEMIYYGVLKETTADHYELEDGAKFERTKYFKTIKFK
jgi:hypothetical protein